MEKRLLGNTGEKLSIVGFGGIVVNGLEQEVANRTVAEAFERGVNYFDVAPTYGPAEEILGPALQPYRDRVFLACKTAEWDKAGAQAELERSLQRLHTDHFDLYQLHGLSSLEQVQQIFAPGGAMETVLAAKKAGAIRYIGFSAHTVEAALAALPLYPFDTVMFPFNFACWLTGFGPSVLAAAKAQGAGRLALKALARGPWPEGAKKNWPKCWYQPLENDEEINLALRFTLSLDITAAVSPSYAELLFKAIQVAENYTPLSPEEMIRLQELVAKVTPLLPLKK